jgi:Mrp family chromosome partitioning ATPase
MNNTIHRIGEFVRYSELKQLAYNTVALQQEKRFHSLTVLSFFPGEGKTLFCAALAMAYVEACRARVLVLDTTTIQNKRSLMLRDCFDGSTPQVDVITLEDLRKESVNLRVPMANGTYANAGSTVGPEIVDGSPEDNWSGRESDFSLIKRLTEDRSKNYGLVLLDTAALHAKNRSNIDPLLVARLSGASVLVVSRQLLESPGLVSSLKVVQDPTLKLIGIASNEGRNR